MSRQIVGRSQNRDLKERKKGPATTGEYIRMREKGANMKANVKMRNLQQWLEKKPKKKILKLKTGREKKESGLWQTGFELKREVVLTTYVRRNRTSAGEKGKKEEEWSCKRSKWTRGHGESGTTYAKKRGVGTGKRREKTSNVQPVVNRKAKKKMIKKRDIAKLETQTFGGHKNQTRIVGNGLLHLEKKKKIQERLSREQKRDRKKSRNDDR